MKILVYGISPEIGGVSEYMMNLFRNIDNNKIQFDFIVTGNKCLYEDEINELGGKVFYITQKKECILKNIKELFNILKKCKNSHKIFYFNTSGIYYNLPILFAKFNKYIVITHAHNTKDKSKNEIFHTLHYFNRILVRNISNYCFACSDLAAKWVYSNTKKKVTIINNFIDCNKFEYNIRKRDLIRKELNISSEQLVIGTVGRLSYQKNQKFLLDIFNNLLQKKPNSILLLVGDGELKGELVDRAKELNINNSVRFLGERRDIDKVVQAMDIFLLPSFFEGFPISLIEAQAAGLKCLVSDTITKTVNITGNVEFYGLENSTEKWTNKILSYTTERLNTHGILAKEGFDIKIEVKKMESFLCCIK